MPADWGYPTPRIAGLGSTLAAHSGNVIPQHLGDGFGSREAGFGDADDGDSAAESGMEVRAEAGLVETEVDVAVDQQDLRQGFEPAEDAENEATRGGRTHRGGRARLPAPAPVTSVSGRSAFQSEKVRQAATAPSWR